MVISCDDVDDASNDGKGTIIVTQQEQLMCGQVMMRFACANHFPEQPCKARRCIMHSCLR